MGPLRDSIGHHSIYADSCESKREHGKGYEKRKIQARLGDGIGDEPIHSGDVVGRQFLAYGEDLVTLAGSSEVRTARVISRGAKVPKSGWACGR